MLKISKAMASNSKTNPAVFGAWHKIFSFRFHLSFKNLLGTVDPQLEKSLFTGGHAMKYTKNQTKDITIKDTINR